jgi:hypothetical protein
MPTATTERARALRLLARCPNGCAEALILAQGFTIPLLAGLVSDRLATVELSSARQVWVQITDLGREALSQQAATGQLVLLH